MTALEIATENVAGQWLVLGRSPAGSAYNYSTFTYGAYKSYKPVKTSGPDTKAGIPFGSPPLTVQNGTSGTFTINTGGVYDLVDFKCLVVVNTNSPVIFTRCLFEGNTTLATPRGLLFVGTGVTAGSQNVFVYDSDFIAQRPSIWWDGIMYHDFTLERCYIARTVDGIGAYTSGSDTTTNVVVKGCHIEKLTYWSPGDPAHLTDTPPKTHNDIVQWQGGDNLTLIGNFFDGTYDATIGDVTYTSSSPNPAGGGPNNSGAASHQPGWNLNSGDLATYGAYLLDGSILQINNNTTSTVANLVFDGNWSTGATRTITMSPVVGGTVTITNNHQTKTFRDGSHNPYNIKTGTTYTGTNNKYDEDGTTVGVNLV